MIFHYVVTHLRWVARVPGAVHLFDAILALHTMLFHPGRARAVERFRDEVERWPNVLPSVHRFGGTGFCLDGSELGHVHGNGLLDVLVGRAAARELVLAGRCEPHHILPDSAWVSFRIRTPADLPRALELMQIARARRVALAAAA